jgi:hypothetical protein
MADLGGNGLGEAAFEFGYMLISVIVIAMGWTTGAAVKASFYVCPQLFPRCGADGIF